MKPRQKKKTVTAWDAGHLSVEKFIFKCSNIRRHSGIQGRNPNKHILTEN